MQYAALCLNNCVVCVTLLMLVSLESPWPCLPQYSDVFVLVITMLVTRAKRSMQYEEQARQSWKRIRSIEACCVKVLRCCCWST